MLSMPGWERYWAQATALASTDFQPDDSALAGAELEDDAGGHIAMFEPVEDLIDR